MKYDYIVIGGGIIGMTTARELSARGARVAILDRQNFGSGASKVAGGILSPMKPWIENSESMILSEEAKKLYPNFVAALEKETDICVELIKSGLIITNKQHAEETRSWADKNEIQFTENINERYSDINIPDYSVLLPDIYQVRPPLLLNALRKSLDNKSVDLYQDSKITHIEIKGNKFEYLELNNINKLRSDNLIVTAGAWSNPFLKSIKSGVNIKPMRGQIICIHSENIVIDRIILDDGNYLIPRLDGHIIVGSTIEDVGFDNETTEKAKSELLNWVYTVVPTLKDTKVIGHWAGLRPSVSDGRPVIGSIPEFENIFINAGHFRKGILQAPAAAKLLTDYLFNNSSFMNIDEFGFQNTQILEN